MSSSSSSFCKEDTIRKVSPKTPNFRLPMLHEIRKEPSVKDRDGLTRNHVEDIVCPHCGSSEIVKAGMMKKDGQEPVQMYKCNSCGRRFTASSIGGISRCKLPTTIVVQFIKSMTNGDTYRTTRELAGISKKTAIYWRFLLFGVAERATKDTVLSGTVYIDEMYFRKDKDTMVPLEKEEQRTMLRKRGLNKDLVCVYLGIDSKNRMAIHVAEKGGKPNSRGILSFLGERIEKGSTLVHDSEKAHKALVRSLSLKDMTFNETREPEKAHEEMDKVNKLCAYLRDECRRHRGIKTKNLQRYLTCFIYLKGMRMKYGYKAYRVVAHEMISESKSIRFSEIFPKKSKKSK